MPDAMKDAERRCLSVASQPPSSNGKNAARGFAPGSHDGTLVLCRQPTVPIARTPKRSPGRRFRSCSR